MSVENDQTRPLKATPISLPPHLFIPDGAEPLDIHKIKEIAKNTTVPERLITLRAKVGETIIINMYGIYTDAELAKDVEFFIKKNKGNALRYHGTPDDPLIAKSYRLNTSLAPDLKNDSLKHCQIQLLPDDVLTIDVVNCITDLDIPMGIRIVGYVQSHTNNTTRLSR